MNLIYKIIKLVYGFDNSFPPKNKRHELVVLQPYVNSIETLLGKIINKHNENLIQVMDSMKQTASGNSEIN